jgi:leader peptidase (prepilin peptidase)/N-methyltransferase
VRFVLAVGLGLLFGGLLNIIIYRLPRQRALFRRPGCSRCGHPLGWEAIPLAGYVLQRGRCRYCGRAIPFFFPLAEALSVFALVALVWRLGLTWMTVLYGFFALTLILTLFVDWLHHDIYYIVLLPATVTALVVPLLFAGPWLNFRSSLFGLLVGTLFFGTLYILGHIIFHSEALGMGDVWLAGMIGAMMGFYNSLVTLTLGIILAAVGAGILMAARRASPGQYIPYGAFMCLAALGYLCLRAPF